MKLFFMDNIGIVGLILLLVVSFLLFMIYVSRSTIDRIRMLFVFKRSGNETEEAVKTENDADAGEEVSSPQVLVTIGEETGVEVTVADDIEDDVADESVAGDYGVECAAEEVVLDDDALAAQFDAMSKSIGETATSDEALLSMEVEKADGDDDMGGDMLRPINPKDELSYYKPPTIDLLDEYEQAVQSIDKDEQAANANKIVDVL